MPTFIAAASVATGTSSALTTPNLAVPTSVQVGDLAIVVGAAERELVPTINWPTAGFTSEEAGVLGTIMASRKGWKRIVSGDLGGVITASVTTSRRMALAVAFYRTTLDPVWTHTGAVTNGSGDFTAEHPAVTPTVANSTIVSVMASTNSVSPFARTYASAAGWTERAEAGSGSTTTNNAFTYLADETLTGGAGVSQAGNVVTDSQEKFIYYASSVVLTPPNLTLTPAGWSEVRLFGRT